MTYAELVAGVDRVRFRTACATLMDEQLATDLCEHALDAPSEAEARLALLLRLFQDLPLYSVLAACRPLLPGLGRHGREPLWSVLTAAVARERTGAADAAETALFADFLADHGTVDEAWGALLAPGQPEACVRTALRVSAPAPWRLKRVAFARLLPDPRWHALLFHALRGALLAFLGPTVDPEEGLQVLERLVLPGREAEVASVRAGLEGLRAAAGRVLR